MAKPLVERPSNVTDATLQKHIRLITGLRVSLDSAQGEYRAQLKAAKADGINTGQLITAMSARRREPEDVMSDLRNYVRYLALCNMPVHQMDMFGQDGAGLAPAPAAPKPAPGPAARAGNVVQLVDPDEDPEHAGWLANEAGFKAGSAGEDMRTNPHASATSEYASWQAGWEKGQKTLITTGGVKKASTRRGRASPGARVN